MVTLGKFPSAYREGGPSVIFLQGAKNWRRDDKRSRYRGPAVVMPNGRKEWHGYCRNGPYVQHPIGDGQ